MPIVLAQRRREVGQGHESGVNLVDELAVRFGFVFHTLPLGVVLEGFPVGGGRLAAGMTEDVDECIALLGVISGRPVGDALDSVAVEDLYGVVAEACQQVC